MPGPLSFRPRSTSCGKGPAQMLHSPLCFTLFRTLPARLATPPTIRLRMTATETMMRLSTVRPGTWRNEAVLGLAGALLALCLHAAGGFPTLNAATSDNDSLLRLVEIRDLIAGQGWFDLHQYRMGPARRLHHALVTSRRRSDRGDRPRGIRTVRKAGGGRSRRDGRHGQHC